MTEDVCRLCNQRKELRDSHIIPSFAIKWLVNTSATGHIRNMGKPNLRIQDGVKIKLLCSDCEQLFSQYEKYFSENIFKPFKEDSEEQFDYDENLRKFVISLNWRVLEAQKDKFIEAYPNWKYEIEKISDMWKSYLMGKRSCPGSFENHILFFGEIESVEGINLEKMNWYFLRHIDCTFIHSDSELYVYSKLPGIAMISCICPYEKPTWKGSLIQKEGKITTEATNDMGEFFINRIEEINCIELSKRQHEKIKESFLSASDEKIEKSETIKVFLAEERLKTSKKQ